MNKFAITYIDNWNKNFPTREYISGLYPFEDKFDLSWIGLDIIRDTFSLKLARKYLIRIKTEKTFGFVDYSTMEIIYVR